MKLVLLLSMLTTSSAFAPSSIISTSKITTRIHAEKEPLFTSATEEKSSEERDRKQTIRDEAQDALVSVGWSAPMMADELTADDPFVRRINEQIQEESGVDLDQLLNPAKVVNLERDLVNLRSQLADLTGITGIDNFIGITTEEIDNGGGGEDADKLRKKISKKEKDLLIERRSVFRGWLKNIFLGQAILSLGLSWIMVTDPSILFGGFDWFSNTNSIDISIQVLGFWWWWLFIVPSLRSRRPKGFEKKALDIAFLATPLVSLLAPVATKDTAEIWIANFAVTAGAYAFAYLTFDKDGDNNDGSKDPEWLKFIYKSLDFGSGRERGARN